MARKNNRGGHPQARRRGPGDLPPPRRNTKLRVPITEMVVPVGRCYFRSRHGKLRFTRAEVDKALKQAQRNREAQGASYSEARYYECPPGGCGDFHLTSRTEYRPKNGD